MRLQVIDYGGGNLGSVLRCLHRLDIPSAICAGSQGGAGEAGLPDPDQPVLLPGVGAFGAVMQGLRDRGLVEPLRALIAGGTPLLGICIGLQVLFERSSESPGVPGLGVLPGEVVRIREGVGRDGVPCKVPQIGWNLLVPGPADPAAPPGHVYFVNSYVAAPQDPGVVLYHSDHGGPFCAAVRRGRLTAFQFHPERSGAFGHQLVRSFWDAC